MTAPTGAAHQPEGASSRQPRPFDVVSQRDRVALFIDGEETGTACREAGLVPDWNKLQALFSPVSPPSCAFYYALDVFPEEGTRLFDKIAASGFVIRKQVQPPTPKDARNPQRADIKLAVAFDMALLTQLYDVAFLFAGSAAYLPIIEPLRSRGKRVYLVTTRRALSNEMRLIANKPIFFLEQIREVKAE